MNQVLNQGTNSASPAEVPMKRRRGRPRKDENQTISKPPVPSIQGEGSGALNATASISLKNKDSIKDVDVDDEDHNNDKMVGQVVIGVLENAFDAGYFLTVRVGDSNVCMRGVVFKESCVVPISPENDIAPNVKMYTRGDILIPPMKSNPQIVQTAGIPSLNPMENFKNQQAQEKVIFESGTQKEDHDSLLKYNEDQQENSLNKEQQENSLDKEQQGMLSNDKEHQGMLSNDKEQQMLLNDNVLLEKLSNDDKEQQEMFLNDKVLQEKLSNNDKEQQETLSKDNKEHQENLSDDKEQQPKISDDKEGLQDSSERPLKFQKTNQTTVSFVNGGQIELSGAADGNSDDAVKSDEAANITVLSNESIIVSPEILSSVKEDSSVVPTAMEQEFQGTPGFQISMEIGDDEDELSEMHSEVSPMEAE